MQPVRTITALKPQKRNKDRVSVFLDGEFAFGLPQEAAGDLRVGQTLTPEAIAALEDEDRFDKAKQYAFRLLSYRPRSVAEVERKMVEKGYEDLLIQRVTAHLKDLSLLDDAEFAAYWVEQRETFKPRGRLALQQELRQKGVPRPVIEQALADLDEAASARRAAEKRANRWADLPFEQFRTKMGRYLQRRGFSYEIIHRTIDEIWETIAKQESP